MMETVSLATATTASNKHQIDTPIIPNGAANSMGIKIQPSSSSSSTAILANCGKVSAATITSNKPIPPATTTTTSNKPIPAISESKRRDLNVGFEEKKIKMEFDPSKELLGSVTTHKFPGTRTSARVIQKMKQDQTRSTTPPPIEREIKREEKVPQKTPSQIRANKATWSNLERNHFFDALNEFGKDFEAIANYINAKLKRKYSSDVTFKTKDQVRQHYYRSYYKICKYLRFADEIKKPVQEMYGLINYGEMRRKLQFISDKHFMKLKTLVYQGHTTVRCKGKNIRIKTPSCKTLRRLNQLDDSLEDIRLPSKIEVIVSPANMESFGRVQSVAQNPHVRTTVPLHKKLISFIRAFQHKWRSSESKLAKEELLKLPFNQPTASTSADNSVHDERLTYEDPAICFLPKPGVTIHRPLLSITEYLSSVNICLGAYEERMGVKVRSDMVNTERQLSKRQRLESGSEKRSPDYKKMKQSASTVEKEEIPALAVVEPAESNDAVQVKSESSGDELNEENNALPTEAALKLPKIETTPSTNEITTAFLPTSSSTSTSSVSPPHLQTVVSDIAPPQVQPAPSTVAPPSGRARRNSKNARVAGNFKPLISEEVIRCIRNGWTVSNSADITIGDLYVVLGQDCKLELEYYWPSNVPSRSAQPSVSESFNVIPFTSKQNGMPYNSSDCDNSQLIKTLTDSMVANKLKHLLLIASLSERIRKRQCSCGHICNATRMRMERDLATQTFISSKTFNSNKNGVGIDCNSPFRQPIAPLRRGIVNMDPVKQLTSLTRQKMSREVFVQRVLMPAGVNRVNHMSSSHNGGLKYSFCDSQVAQNNQSKSSDISAETSRDELSRNMEAIPISSSMQSSAVNAVTFTGSLPSLSMMEIPGENDDIIVGGEPEQKDQVFDSIETFETGCESRDMSLPMSVPDSSYDDCSTTSLFNSMSPMHLLRDSTSNSRWLEDNLNDFSLTSLLGHLDEINASRDILDPSSSLSVISETSVDYRHKFQEIAALMQSQDKD